MKSWMRKEEVLFYTCVRFVLTSGGVKANLYMTVIIVILFNGNIIVK